MPKSNSEKSKTGSRDFTSPSALDRSEEIHKNFSWAQGLALATSLVALRKFPVKALAGVLGTGILIGIGIATYKRQKQEPF